MATEPLTDSLVDNAAPSCGWNPGGDPGQQCGDAPESGGLCRAHTLAAAELDRRERTITDDEMAALVRGGHMVEASFGPRGFVLTKPVGRTIMLALDEIRGL